MMLRVKCRLHAGSTDGREGVDMSLEKDADGEPAEKAAEVGRQINEQVGVLRGHSQAISHKLSAVHREPAF